MKIKAIQCENCQDIVYSRARHDMRDCTCGKVAIDGGFDYIKISYIESPPSRIEVDVEATREELFNDWNERINKYGLIKKN